MKPTTFLLLLLNLTAWNIAPAIAKEKDPCAPFFDLEAVKKEDEMIHMAQEKIVAAQGTLGNGIQGDCATLKSDNTLANQKSTITDVGSKEKAALQQNSDLHEAVMAAIKSEKQAVEALNKDQRPKEQRAQCFDALEKDRQAIEKGYAKVKSDRGGAIAGCKPVPPTATASNVSVATDTATNSVSTDSNIQMAAGKQGYERQEQCRSSLAGCSLGSDGLYHTNLIGSGNALAPAPIYAPVDSNGQVILHNCPAGKICR